MISDARIKANKKWNRKNLYQFGVAIPIEYKEILQKKVKDQGISMNKYIRGLIENDLKQEGLL